MKHISELRFGIQNNIYGEIEHIRIILLDLYAIQSDYSMQMKCINANIECLNMIHTAWTNN